REARTAPGRLRVAWTTRPASGEKIDRECVAAVESTVALLEDLGHTVFEGAPRYDWERFLEATHVVWVAFTAQFVDALSRMMQRPASRETLEAVTLACYRDG